MPQAITTFRARLVRCTRPFMRNELRRTLEAAFGFPVYYQDRCFWHDQSLIVVRQDEHFLWVREPYGEKLYREGLEPKFHTRCVTFTRRT